MKIVKIEKLSEEEYTALRNATGGWSQSVIDLCGAYHAALTEVVRLLTRDGLLTDPPMTTDNIEYYEALKGVIDDDAV